MAYKFQLGAATMSGSLVQEGSLAAESLNANNGGLSQAGAIAGVTTISGSGKFEMGSLAFGGTDVTATAAELNILDGVTATTAEINHLGGVTSGVQSQLDAKLAIASDLSDLNDASTARTNLGVAIGSDVQAYDADLDTLSGMQTGAAAALALLTSAEVALLDGAAADTVVNSKAVIYGSAGEVNAASFDISGIEVISSAGNLAVNAIEFNGNIDVASAGAFSLGASMGANTMTLGGSTSTVRIAGDLEVVGTLNRVTETELLIEDKAVIVASGSANAAAAAGAGLVVDIASGDMTWLYQANGENVGGVDASASGDIFVASGSAGLIDIQAANFYGAFNGDGSGLSGVSVSLNINEIGDANATLAIGVNVATANTTAARTWTLPASPSVGQSVRVKVAGVSSGAITVQRAGSQTIDGTETSILLESDNAAVELIYVASDDWRVF